MNVIIATLGFDERHVIRSIIRLGLGNVKAVRLLVPKDGLEERTQKALNEIKNIASVAGVDDVTLYEVPVENFSDAVASIRKLMVDLIKEGYNLLVSLGGGLRALVVETLIASLLLPKSFRERVKIVVDLEHGRGSVELSPLIPIDVELSAVEEELLKLFTKYEKLTLAEAVRLVQIPRSTAWKELEKLVSKGLLEKEGTIYRLSKAGELILKILLTR